MNNPHEKQAAAMARAGELTDGEQLRECINSGQVSAAHAGAGELSMSMFASREDFDKAVAHQEAGEAQEQIRKALLGRYGYTPTPGPWFGHFNCVTESPRYGEGRMICVSSGTRGKTEAEEANNLFIAACNPENIRAILAALAAERAEVARLRAEIEAIREDASEWARYVIEDNAPLSLENYIEREMDKRASKGEKT